MTSALSCVSCLDLISHFNKYHSFQRLAFFGKNLFIFSKEIVITKVLFLAPSAKIYFSIFIPNWLHFIFQSIFFSFVSSIWVEIWIFNGIDFLAHIFWELNVVNVNFYMILIIIKVYDFNVLNSLIWGYDSKECSSLPKLVWN